jgi:hypothetical protein
MTYYIKGHELRQVALKMESIMNYEIHYRIHYKIHYIE